MPSQVRRALLQLVSSGVARRADSVLAGPAAAASWIVDLPAGDLSSKLATEIFVPTSHCRSVRVFYRLVCIPRSRSLSVATGFASCPWSQLPTGPTPLERRSKTSSEPIKQRSRRRQCVLFTAPLSRAHSSPAESSTSTGRRLRQALLLRSSAGRLDQRRVRPRPSLVLVRACADSSARCRTTKIKVALHVTEVLSEATAGPDSNLSYGQRPRPPHAPHQTAPPIIYTAIVVIMRMRNEQSRLGSTSAQSHGFESALMCEFLGLVIIVELVDELDAPALQGSLDAWRRYVRTVAAESYRATRHFVACGGLGGHFAHDAASWFLEHMPAPEEGEFDVLLRTAERAIRWVEMLFEVRLPPSSSAPLGPPHPRSPLRAARPLCTSPSASLQPHDSPTVSSQSSRRRVTPLGPPSSTGRSIRALARRSSPSLVTSCRTLFAVSCTSFDHLEQEAAHVSRRESLSKEPSCERESELVVDGARWHSAAASLENMERQLQLDGASSCNAQASSRDARRARKVDLPKLSGSTLELSILRIEQEKGTEKRSLSSSYLAEARKHLERPPSSILSYSSSSPSLASPSSPPSSSASSSSSSSRRSILGRL